MISGLNSRARSHSDRRAQAFIDQHRDYLGHEIVLAADWTGEYGLYRDPQQEEPLPALKLPSDLQAGADAIFEESRGLPPNLSRDDPRVIALQTDFETLVVDIAKRMGICEKGINVERSPNLRIVYKEPKRGEPLGLSDDLQRRLNELNNKRDPPATDEEWEKLQADVGKFWKFSVERHRAGTIRNSAGTVVGVRWFFRRSLAPTATEMVPGKALSIQVGTKPRIDHLLDALKNPPSTPADIQEIHRALDNTRNELSQLHGVPPGTVHVNADKTGFVFKAPEAGAKLIVPSNLANELERIRQEIDRDKDKKNTEALQRQLNDIKQQVAVYNGVDPKEIETELEGNAFMFRKKKSVKQPSRPKQQSHLKPRRSATKEAEAGGPVPPIIGNKNNPNVPGQPRGLPSTSAQAAIAGTSDDGSLGTGAIVGIAIGSVAAVAIIILGVVLYIRRRKRQQMNDEEKTN